MKRIFKNLIQRVNPIIGYNYHQHQQQTLLILEQVLYNSKPITGYKQPIKKFIQNHIHNTHTGAL